MANPTNSLITNKKVGNVNFDQVARASKPPKAVDFEELELHQGVVKAVNVVAGTVDITIGGDPAIIPNVRVISNYRATIDDTIYALGKGSDLFVIDRLTNKGPSVTSTAGAGFIAGTLSFAAAGAVNGTFYLGVGSVSGPGLTPVSVSPSGLCLVGVSSWISATTAGNGGAMGVNIVGISPSNNTTNITATLGLSQVTYVGTANAIVAATRTILYTNLPPGDYNMTTAYACIGTGSSAQFSNRQIWALPL